MKIFKFESDFKAIIKNANVLKSNFSKKLCQGKHQKSRRSLWMKGTYKIKQPRYRAWILIGF